MTKRLGLFGWLIRLFFGEQKPWCKGTSFCRAPADENCRSENCFAHCSVYCHCQTMAINLTTDEIAMINESRRFKAKKK